jgi:hypothetical protein
MYRASGEGVTPRGSGAGLVAAAALLLAGACATAPEGARPDVSGYLLADQAGYVAVDVSDNAELVARLVGTFDPDAAGLVERVDVVAASLHTTAAGPAGFDAVALGEFPRGGVRYALRRDPAFERTVLRLDGTRIVYFSSTNGELEITVPRTGVVLFSTGSVTGLAQKLEAGDGVAGGQESGTSVAPIFAELGRPRGPDAFFLLADPASFLGGRLGLDLTAVPIHGLVLQAVVAPESGGISLSGDFTLATEAQAALFARLGRVFVLSFMRSLGLDTSGLRESLEIGAVGTQLEFRGVIVTEAELEEVVRRIGGIEP